MKHLEKTLGFSLDSGNPAARQSYLQRCIHLQLTALGLPFASPRGDAAVLDIASGLRASYRQKSRLLEDYRCPADRRIESFLQQHVADLKLPFVPRLPGQTFVLEQHAPPHQATARPGTLAASRRLSHCFIENPANSEDVDRMKVRDRLEMAEPELTRVSSSDYQQSLVGTIGADPIRAP